ncbi:MAG: hypothetical protein Salg2KO_14500 [Salibacteraceae bacterium]
MQARYRIVNYSSKLWLKAWITLLTLCVTLTVHAQSITNEGNDFWFGFTEPLDGTTTVATPPDTSIVFQANISSRFNTTGFVEIPGTAFFQSFSVSANSVTKVIIPDSLAWVFTSDSVQPRAIHVHSEKGCVVYANTFHQFRSEASLVLPNRALGSEYYAMTSYPIMLNFNYAGQLNPGPWRSEFMVVAPGKSVTVEITPTGNTRGGHLANVPFTVTLDSGDLFQVQGDSMEDLTGSRIVCLNPDDQVAVFGGNVWSQVFCGTTSDPLYEAMFPVASWGKEYILIPTPDVGVDMYRVLAEEDGTEIYKDGNLLATINAGEFYQDTHQVARLISSNNRISVGQFMVSNGGGTCSNLGQGDPSMVMINPNEQMFLDSITFFAVSEVNITLNHVVIVTRTNDTSTLELDGIPVTGFEVLDADTNFSYTSVLIDTGSHNLFTSGCGFLAYSIGLGNAESYSYAAGVRLTDLEGGVEFSNISANSDTICQFDSIQFTVNAIGNPFLFNWSFGDGTTSQNPNPIHQYDSGGVYFIDVVIVSQCRTDTVEDTIVVVALPSFELGDDTIICLQDTFELRADSTALSYIWNTNQTTERIRVDSTGGYSVTVSNTRCQSSDSVHIEFRPTENALSVNPIDTLNTVCEEDLFRFEGITSRVVDSWLWNLGDGTIDTARVIEHGYEQSGGYPIELRVAYPCGSLTYVDTLRDSVIVTQTPALSARQDTFSCTPEITLKPRNPEDPRYSYTWITPNNPSGINSYEITSSEIGEFKLIINNNGCVSTDSFRVDFGSEFIIPNVFTPNRDGINDMFRIKATPQCRDFDELRIYNRWGMLVYYTTRPITEGWDGHGMSGEAFPSGTYYYQLTGDDGTFSGTLNLILD